jgi:hypothetical protein
MFFLNIYYLLPVNKKAYLLLLIVPTLFKQSLWQVKEVNYNNYLIIDLSKLHIHF